MSAAERRAVMEFLRDAVLQARSLAWSCGPALNRLSGEREAQIGDLMDLVHNLPELVSSPHWNASLFLDELDSFDRKWPGRGLRARHESLLKGQ